MLLQNYADEIEDARRCANQDHERSVDEGDFIWARTDHQKLAVYSTSWAKEYVWQLARRALEYAATNQDAEDGKAIGLWTGMVDPKSLL